MLNLDLMILMSMTEVLLLPKMIKSSEFQEVLSLANGIKYKINVILNFLKLTEKISIQVNPDVKKRFLIECQNRLGEEILINAEDIMRKR